MKKCEHGLYFKDCKFCSIYEDTQGLIDKSLLLNIEVKTKAQEFLEYIKEHSKQSPFMTDESQMIYRYIWLMKDVEWDDILATIAVNRTRDTNVGKFNLPKYNETERRALTDFIWLNNECGLHNSYWSRMWWMVKGGKLIKMFPPNSVLEAFERGERKSDDSVYRR